MLLISVNVATPEPIATKSGLTGIFKRPQEGPVHIGALGLAGDAIVDTKNHGGLDQAVYLFGVPDLEWWSSELGRELEVGSTFGENLTITGLVSAEHNAGDRFRIGAVLLEVTSPRIPCATLAARMGDPGFVKRFAAVERFGLYCRVLEEGAVQAGDEVDVQPYAGDTISALEMFRAYYRRDADAAMLRRALSGPMHRGMRREYEVRLAELAAAAR